MACRNVSFSQFYKNYIRYCNRRLCNTSVQIKDHGEHFTPEIVVPRRIPRGPTDILKALASTIKKDYTAAHYKYEDDPYMMPVSNVSKRSYALSKEAGKKAARFFLEKYPDVFLVNKSEPFIEAFQPPVVYDEESDVSEETLLTCINSTEVSNALTVYKLLNDKGVPLSQETKQSLLELLCFYNNEEPPNEDYCEERWFAKTDNSFKNTWQPNGAAEKLFEELGSDNAAAYCAIVQGCSKYMDVERAVFLFEEMCSKNLTGTIEMYNSLLSIVPFIKHDGDMRWEYAMYLVGKMNEANLNPNLNTMNSLLGIMSKTKRWSKQRSIAMHLFAEMKELGIEPSLGSYYHLIQIFCFNHHGYSQETLLQILEQIEGREFTIRHSDDVQFFPSAMEVCNRFVEDKDIGYRLHALLEFGNNSKFLGSALSESLYFQQFFNLMTRVEDFDKFMEIYERYVPNTYTPEPRVMQNIIVSLDFNAAYHHLPKICSDIMLFEQTEREKVLGELLNVIASVKHEEKMQQQLMTMIWNIIQKLDERAENQMRATLQWTGEMLGDVLKIFLDGDDLDKAWIIMQRFKTDANKLVGTPEESVLLQFCTYFLAVKQFGKVEFCVKLANDWELLNVQNEVLKQIKDLFKKEVFDENDRFQVDKIFGSSFLDDNENHQHLKPKNEDESHT